MLESLLSDNTSQEALRLLVNWPKYTLCCFTVSDVMRDSTLLTDTCINVDSEGKGSQSLLFRKYPHNSHNPKLFSSLFIFLFCLIDCAIFRINMCEAESQEVLLFKKLQLDKFKHTNIVPSQFCQSAMKKRIVWALHPSKSDLRRFHAGKYLLHTVQHESNKIS